jgi:hypothetical protein
MTIAQYSFLPWLRRGIANQLAGPATASRAAVEVTLTVASDVETVPLTPRNVQLVGPGDVIGINPQVVVRTEPRNWITDFEPNYLAFVEFYDEDFPWRYTPAPPDTGQHRLTPWITLLVLEEGEFTRNTSPSRPLPLVTLSGVTPNVALPPDSQLWAWAHVHVNGSFSATHTPDLSALRSILRVDPDRGYSRLVSPRRLEPNTAYYAFVIPAFEVGRKAGLGEPIADTDPGLAIAWTTATEFPVYYEWFFRTGAAGDFEQLVRALRPRAIDKRVGIRDLDIQQPGFTLPPITSPPDDVVGLEGALLSPYSESKPLDPGSNFPAEIEEIVNLPADMETSGVTVGDPVVSAPLYARWHALVQRISVDPSRRNWVNELNGDPRLRSVAGFGTSVIQRKQEEYMKLAWQQIGEILAVNRRIHFVQVSMQASQLAFQKHLAPLPDETALAVSSPVFRKVMASPTTVHALVEQSQLPRAAMSGAFRKQLRPRGALARRTFPGREATRSPLAEAVARLNAGAISAAPPRQLPEGPTLERFAGRAARAISEPLRAAAANRWLLLLLALFVCALFLIIGPSILARVVALVVAGAAVAGFYFLRNRERRRRAGEAIRPTALTPEAVRDVPPAPTFVLAPPGAAVPTAAAAARPPGPPVDSTDARDFRRALLDFHELLSVRSDPPAPRSPLSLHDVRTRVQREIEPVRAFPQRVAPMLKVGFTSLGAYLRDTYQDMGPSAPAERIVPVMAYPDIRRPMYEPLRDISSELLVPNLRLIEPNTISLMVRNQVFIEAYMVGLNHEFARELLWREFPTDQRPSTFRQFWDVSNAANTQGLDPATFEESLRDITRIHEWPSTSLLGEHNNRRKPSDPPETAGTPLLQRPVVLVIRGDLLKRYPNTVIYAQRAKWGQRADNALRLVLWDETGEKSETDPADPNIRHPLYKAFVPPDIHFIGFDLSIDEAQGDPSLEETAEAKARTPANRLGWFFVLKEVVGEPRFGLDEHPPDAPGEVKWDNLSWDNLGSDVKVIDTARPFATQPGGTKTGGVDWGTNAADMAFILYQKPVLVAVHAREMLRSLTS